MLFCISMVFFYLTSTTNPGYLKGTSPLPFLSLVERLDPNNLCPECEVPCQTTSRHCYICNQCVSDYDHHCNWVNNCIGGHNHRFFLIFIMSQSLYMISMLTLVLTRKYLYNP